MFFKQQNKYRKTERRFDTNQLVKTRIVLMNSQNTGECGTNIFSIFTESSVGYFPGDATK